MKWPERIKAKELWGEKGIQEGLVLNTDNGVLAVEKNCRGFEAAVYGYSFIGKGKYPECTLKLKKVSSVTFNDVNDAVDWCYANLGS